MTWCHDTARDEAVRAAEDGRTGPLPTLEECIAMLPKSGSSTSAVEHENKGNGMRTERITLEVTHDLDARLSDWIVEVIDESLGLMESVRVVEDDRVLAASKKLIEVDQEAALRGFDTTTFQRLWISAIARVLGLELARPPRSKCDNPGDGSIPSPGILASPALVEAHQQIATLTTERDDAIRERDAHKEEYYKLRAEKITQALTADRFASAVAEADTLRARVAELEAQTSTAGEGSCAAQAASGGGEPQCVSSGSCGATTGDSVQDWHLASSGREPVAWLCEWTDHTSLHQSQAEAERAADGDVVPQPLYREPPQPRGWLTEEEREIIAGIADDDEYTEEGQNIAKALLARSSPPEVVLPFVDPALARMVYGRDSEWLAALAAAGVPVKEVGRG